MFLVSDIINKISNKLRDGKREDNFQKIAEEWLNYKKNMVKESTYSNYVYSVEKYLYPEYGEKNINKIKDCNDFIYNLSDTLAPKTVRDIITKLKAIFKYYEEEYNQQLNIKKMSLPKLGKNQLKILSKKEKEKLENYCLKENTLKSLGIIICLNTGMRVGEICALKWENVDLDKKIISVKKTLQRVYLKKENKSVILIDTPKSNSSVRDIPINKKLYEILKKIKGGHKGEDYVLTGSNTKYVEPRNYQHSFKMILKKCKIKSYKFHILRHTFATNCIEVGMDMKSLSEILGHADVNVTLNIYVHPSNKIKKKFLEKL